MLKIPLWIPAVLLAFLSLGGTARAAIASPAPPGRIAAPSIEQVRFESRGGPSRRGARHIGRGRAAGCRRCGRRGDTFAVLAITRAQRSRPEHKPGLPQRSTFTLRKESLGPLRVRLYSSTWVEACEEKHPTFVARTGTFAAEDGARQRCE